MPRAARIVIPGIPHHITQRGNNRQNVFFSNDDYRSFLQILTAQTAKHELKILGYCLMPNHFHLVALPINPDSLAKGIGRTNFTYSQLINRRYGRSGHLWQNRFYSCALDDEHLLTAMRYIEQNPAKAGIVTNPALYKWSSAKAHVSGVDPLGIMDLSKWENTMNGNHWERMLSEPFEDSMVRRITNCTFTGRPLAGVDFIEQYEPIMKCKLQSSPVGRPRQKK